MKAKKILARMRVSKFDRSRAMVGEGTKSSSTKIVKKGVALSVKGRSFGDDGSSSRTPGILQLDSATWVEVGFNFGRWVSDKIEGGLGKELREAVVDHEVVP